jgi:hypothetical protein
MQLLQQGLTSDEICSGRSSNDPAALAGKGSAALCCNAISTHSSCASSTMNPGQSPGGMLARKPTNSSALSPNFGVRARWSRRKLRANAHRRGA